MPINSKLQVSMIICTLWCVCVCVENLVKVNFQPQSVSLQIAQSQNVSVAFRYQSAVSVETQKLLRM